MTADAVFTYVADNDAQLSREHAIFFSPDYATLFLGWVIQQLCTIYRYIFKQDIDWDNTVYINIESSCVT